MRSIIHLNNDWEFTPEWNTGFAAGEGEAEIVRLPHTCAVTPYDYFDESIYQMVCGYRRRLDLSERGDRRVYICFGAAAHDAKVYLDGVLIGEHKSGYTAFEFELVTENPSPLLAVELDTRESLNFPPFGKVIDYMTYGGLYREVRLEFRESAYIGDLFAKPSIPAGIRVSPKMNPKLVAGLTFDGTVDCDLEIIGDADTMRLYVTPKDSDTVLAETVAPVSDRCTLTVPRTHLWDALSPTLYDLHAELLKEGEVIDSLSSAIGFRRAEFKKDGFYLNGRKFKLRGLNRHQCWPYVGYAMPRAMQRMDADVLKYELGCNAVRTSHYPQSHHFIDRCDELGMPVFTEIPGWQNLGDDEWKDVAVGTVEEMVRQYRNHPSSCVACVSTRVRTTTIFMSARTRPPTRSIPPVRPAACAATRTASCWRTSIPTMTLSMTAYSRAVSRRRPSPPI